MIDVGERTEQRVVEAAAANSAAGGWVTPAPPPTIRLHGAPRTLSWGQADEAKHPRDLHGRWRSTGHPDWQRLEVQGQNPTAERSFGVAASGKGDWHSVAFAPGVKPELGAGQVLGTHSTMAEAKAAAEQAALDAHENSADFPTDSPVAPAPAPKTGPGRGPSGKLRNFEAMSDTKLAALMADVISGDDQEAKLAILAAAKKRGWAAAKVLPPKGTAAPSPAPSAPKVTPPAVVGMPTISGHDVNSAPPMRFEQAPLADVPKYVADPNIVFQQKIDGIRAQLVLSPGAPPAFRSSSGKPLVSSTAVQTTGPILKALPDYGGPPVVVDGEVLGGTFHVFDLIQPGQEKRPYLERQAMAETFAKTLGLPAVKALPTARSSAEKQQLYDKVYANGGEGVMMKRADSPYSPGQRVKHTLKAKFRSTVDAVIMERDRDGHSNFVLGLHDADGKLHEIGTSSAIGKPDGQPGDVIEVAYLYAMPGTNSIVQPSVVKLRPDKAPEDATVDQLRFVNKDVLDAEALNFAPAAAKPSSSPPSSSAVQSSGWQKGDLVEHPTAGRATVLGPAPASKPGYVNVKPEGRSGHSYWRAENLKPAGAVPAAKPAAAESPTGLSKVRAQRLESLMSAAVPMSKVPRFVFRTEAADSAYKGKTALGPGHYYGLREDQVAEMTLDPHSETVQEADYSQVERHELPADLRVLMFNEGDWPHDPESKTALLGGEALRQAVLDAGYDALRVDAGEDLNLAGDQLVVYRDPHGDPPTPHGDPPTPDSPPASSGGPPAENWLGDEMRMSDIHREGFGPTPITMLVTTGQLDMERFASPALGRLLVPDMQDGAPRTEKGGIPFAADNGGFWGVDEAKYKQMCEKLAAQDVHPLWVTVPDVLIHPEDGPPYGDWKATANRYDQWQPYLAHLGLPAALVAQDGLDSPEGLAWLEQRWDTMSCVFIGGSDDFKLGPGAAKIAQLAHDHGKLVHVGRVNTHMRVSYARDILHADSLDGAGWAKWKDKRLPSGLKYAPSGDAPPTAVGRKWITSAREALKGLHAWPRPPGRVAPIWPSGTFAQAETVNFQDVSDALYEVGLSDAVHLHFTADQVGFAVEPTDPRQAGWLSTALGLAAPVLAGTRASWPRVLIVPDEDEDGSGAVALAQRLALFNPHQPRDPGGEYGGQWISGGGPHPGQVVLPGFTSTAAETFHSVAEDEWYAEQRRKYGGDFDAAKAERGWRLERARQKDARAGKLAQELTRLLHGGNTFHDPGGEHGGEFAKKGALDEGISAKPRGSSTTPGAGGGTPPPEDSAVAGAPKDGGARVAAGAPPAGVTAGFKAATAEDRARLKLPPAWTDVQVNPDPKGGLQAVGKDRKGRRVSLYSAEHHAEAARVKFAKLRALHSRMPAIVAQIEQDAEDGNQEAVAALLIQRTGLRPGSTKDTGAEEQAYGASTLLDEHVAIDGDSVHLTFTGKKAVAIDLTVEDATLADVLRERLDEDPGGDLFDTDDAKLRGYLSGVQEGLRPKDFRTYLATATAYRMAGETPPPADEKEFNRVRKQLGARVSKLLGNTPEVALASYIDPAVFDPWAALLGIRAQEGGAHA